MKRKQKVGHETCTMAVPDGGWGWVVMASSVVISTCAPSIVSCFGLVLHDIRVAMPGRPSAASTAWISSLSQSLNFLSTPFVAMMAFTYSFQKVAFIGGILISLGMSLTYFAGHLEVLYLTIGMMGGLGFGLSVKSSLFVVNEYFDKRRGLATGAFFSGAAIGRLIFPLLIQFLLETYGYRGTVLIWGAILSHICVAAAFYQPLAWHKVHVPGPECAYLAKEREEEEKLNKDDLKSTHQAVVTIGDDEKVTNSMNGMNGLLKVTKPKRASSTVNPPSNGAMTEKDALLENGIGGRHRTTSSSASVANLASSLDIFCTEERCGQQPSRPESKKTDEERDKEAACCCCPGRFLKQLDFTVFKEPRFYVVALSAATNSFATTNTFVFLPPLGRSKGLSSTEAAWLLSSVGIGEFFGRLVVPWMQDLRVVKAKYVYMVGAIVSSAVSVALTLPESYLCMVSLCIVFGLAAGSMTGLNAVLNVETLGLARLASSLSFAQFGQGLFSLPSGPILGAIRDATGNYVRCFYVIAAFYMCSFLIWFAETVISYRSDKKFASEATKS